MGNGKIPENRFVNTIVVLLRNTTWRCGRLERLIIRHLHSRYAALGKPEMAISEMLSSFKLVGRRKNDFLDAMRRLERRNIIRIMRFAS